MPRLTAAEVPRCVAPALALALAVAPALRTGPARAHAQTLPVVGAGIQGCWNGSMQLGMFGRIPIRLTLMLRRGVLEGTFQGPGGAPRAIEHGRVTPDAYEFEVPARHGRMRIRVTVSGNSLRGEVRVERQGRLPFDARRC